MVGPSDSLSFTLHAMTATSLVLRFMGETDFSNKNYKNDEMYQLDATIMIYYHK